MSELTATALRLGLLVLMWVFVLSVASTLRRDIFGTTSRGRKKRSRERSASAPAPQRPGHGSTPPPPSGPPRTLVVTEGSLAGAVVALGTVPIMIGRSPESTLVLGDDFVSSRHARIFPGQNGWMLEDLGSTNGTKLNGNDVTGQVQLGVGQPIAIGRTVLELRS
ncbi:FHA domain-containing protein FhaB/FipA [Spelaeicoccus albus]|uniref:FHA domain-containing protein n=1 Tax=Spelaeicoccus albus TaxID=1280376 RepID=A0A7Z0D1Q2_9MICO|nr:FHA domain-containing protein [Spelaeicoccus albus]NYI66612.1 hypothetical protein [Spelaeicoccus albus]